MPMVNNIIYLVKNKYHIKLGYYSNNAGWYYYYCKWTLSKNIYRKKINYAYSNKIMNHNNAEYVKEII